MLWKKSGAERVTAEWLETKKNKVMHNPLHHLVFLLEIEVSYSF
jgi:hypothetical protein